MQQMVTDTQECPDLRAPFNFRKSDYILKTFKITNIVLGARQCCLLDLGYFSVGSNITRLKIGALMFTGSWCFFPLLCGRKWQHTCVQPRTLQMSQST
jgi:hypothetical protein